MVDLYRMRGQWEQLIPGLRGRGWSEADLADLHARCRADMASGRPDLADAWAAWVDLTLRDLVTQSCRNCAHRATPGKAEGYCSARPELPLAYGTYHPLRRLSADGGRQCDSWRRA